MGDPDRTLSLIISKVRDLQSVNTKQATQISALSRKLQDSDNKQQTLEVKVTQLLSLVSRLENVVENLQNTVENLLES